MQQHFYSRNSFAYFIVGLFVFTATILRGQTQYIGANNGDWATATNWNNGLPSAVNPPTIGGGAIVCINGILPLNFPINNFGTIVNKGTATLTSNLIGGNLDNQANFTVAVGAQVNINAGFTNSGIFTNRGATNINSVAGSNAALGTINNEGAWDQLSAFTNNGLLDCKAGVFSSPTTITNNKNLEVRSGASYKVDFGGSFVNATGSLINNAGNLTNLGSFTNNTLFNNTGTYTNNGTHDCFGTLNNESGGQINSTATMNFTGQLNNKLGATLTSGFRFTVNAGGFVSNIGTFNNNNMVDVKLGGTFSNEVTGIVNLGFGSTIVNGGYIKTLAGSKITGNGSITNNKKLESYGLIESNNGATITNTDTLCNFGTIKNVNTVTNSKYWKNSGILENNSGGILTNTGNFENFKGATVSNNYEIYNKPAATMTNNGTFANAIRLFNEGLFTNNAYLVTTGDIYNRVGATLTNTEVIEIKEGAIINEGTINNQKLFFNNSCSVISNKATINNTGRLESWGIVFQRGTVTGTQIVSNAGYVQTAATSAAPSICRDTVKTGVDPIGEAKVYGQNPLKAGLGIDECGGFQYFVDNTTRAVYHCPQVGQTLTVPFKLLTRTGDSLTCSLKIFVFDNVPPVITGCPKDVTIITDQTTATHTWTAPTAVDNCSGVPVFATTKASGSSFPLGLTEVIITATDASNVQAECRFKVNVRQVVATGTCSPTDNTGPAFGNCPANQTLATQNGSAVAVWNEPSVTDACLPILLCASANSGQRFPVGTTTVIYTATDSKNNASTCSFTVTVTGGGDPCLTDNILPVISNCAGNFFTTLNPAINGGVGVWATPSASDNCSAVTLTSNFQTGTIFPAGNTVVTYTAKDAKNNTSTCSFTINVAATNPCAGDVTPPSITCPANVAVNATGNSATATWTVPTATDNCGTPSVNATHASGQLFQVGVTTVTYAASDANGNRKTCTFTVTVNNPCFTDTIAPVLVNCPANQTLNTTTGTATATWTAPTATDNCTLAGITSNYASGYAFGVGTTAVVYTATDNNANKASCTFTVTVANSTVTPVSCTGNLDANFSFESDLVGYDNWGSTVITTDARSGSKAAKVGTAAGGFAYVQSAVIPNATYTFKSWNKISGTVSWAGVGIVFYDANWVKLTASEVNTAVTSTTYTETTVVNTAPANAVYMHAYTWKSGTTGYLISDDWCVTVVANPCTTLTNSAVTEYFVNNTWYQGSSVTVNAGTSLILSANPNSLVSYTWTGPNGFSQLGNTGGDVLVSSAITTAQAGVYTVVLKDANNCTATKSITVNVTPKSYAVSNCNANGEQLIFKGAIDYIAIGNTMSQSEDRSNCAQNASSSKALTLPAGAVVKAAYLYWSGSGALDNTVSLNGNTVVAQGSKTYYEPNWGMSFFAARADVTSLVRNSGTFTVNNLTWNNTGNYCYANSAYGAWSLAVVYEQVTLPYSTIHVNTDKFQYTYPAANYNSYINCVNVPAGVSSNAKLTIVSFEGDNYKGEKLYIGGVYRGDNNFRGQSGPNLDILTFDVASVVTPATTSLNYYVQSYLTNSIWGNAIEGLFDYVKILKYNTGSSVTALISQTNKDVLQLEASAESHKARIEWINNTGAKNDYFTLEKLNPTTGAYDKLDIIKNKSAIDENEQYVTYDNDPTEGDNIYRIKVTYLDGTTRVSDAKTLTFKGIESISLFPNPANDYVDIDLKKFNGLQVTISVYNQFGKLIQSSQVEKASSAPFHLEFGDVATGSYLIRVQAQGKKEVMRKLQIVK